MNFLYSIQVMLERLELENPELAKQLKQDC